MSIMKVWKLIAAVMLLVAVAGMPPGEAREPGAVAGVTGEQLLAETLAGETSKEAVTHLYTFEPGTVMPWHIHPDAHEVAYVIEGDFVMEIEGRDRLALKPGQSFYLAPNEVHRGINEGALPVKLFVVRIKPKDKPLATNVPAPGSTRPSP
jgi:quercetin dioxygenase-like cupin family protein